MEFLLLLLAIMIHYLLSGFWRGLQKALGTKINFSTAYHPQSDGQTERVNQTLEDLLRACVLDFGGSWEDHISLVEFSYNNSFQSSIGMAPFEALYGRPCRSPSCWLEAGEKLVLGSNFICVSPMMGVVRFSRSGKLAPRYIGPFPITECIGSVAYHLLLPA